MLGGEETNLHAVWDTAVVAALGDDPAAVSAELEARITPRQASAWSRGGPADWANESFAIAKHDIYGPLLGAEEEGGPIQLPDDYAVRERDVAAVQLEKAGVRLAMVLNMAFSASPVSTATSDAVMTTRDDVITPGAASSYVGQTVTIRGFVGDVHVTRGGVTFIDMGGRYPDNAFTAVIFDEDKMEFPNVASLDGRTIEITGRVRLHRGKPEIVLRSAEQMKVRR